MFRRSKKHQAESVIKKEPVVQRHVVHEHPVIVHRQHHVQPIIHEKVRHIKPVHRTEITTERPIITREVIVQDSGVVAHKPTVGQKLKGTVKELSGAITRNPAKKEEGRMLKRGMATTQPAYM
ncbi:uncharacterized protein ACA1_230270 [Acanthamoeba castellanii str. Neff]|uniref:Uncharacterized protein n=1 Tax=Acanthamoeba castellanii (strain ATCC 30010 / Neff) TaxID=1257118 RepID=L8H8W1_ACACF|nr:uncharacterized protein ACA1_230270 [Acanthamoeba castellanii str. Neff]ELR21652.1 hypothetical protein ACA1_230270 [Acanthamoeba castellanii str. Neff]